MADGNILSDFGIDLLEEEIDDVIFQTNEFLTDATFTGSQGPFWWILQMCMALAALFAIIMAAGMAYKMMVKHEPLDVMKLFRPLAVSLILCWWYPPADTGMANSGSNWCFLDFLSYIPNCVGSYTHDLYEAEASQISDKFEEVHHQRHVCRRPSCRGGHVARRQHDHHRPHPNPVLGLFAGSGVTNPNLGSCLYAH